MARAIIFATILALANMSYGQSIQNCGPGAKCYVIDDTDNSSSDVFTRTREFTAEFYNTGAARVKLQRCADVTVGSCVNMLIDWNNDGTPTDEQFQNETTNHIVYGLPKGLYRVLVEVVPGASQVANFKMTPTSD